MPKIITNAKEATALVQEKQQLEVNLAWELLDVFNKTKDLIDPLRDCADLALQEMICIRDGIGPAAVQNAINEEIKIMAVLKKERPSSKLKDKGKDDFDIVDKAEKLEILLKEVSKMDAQDVSDIVRLYGTFVEKAAKEKELTELYKLVEDRKNAFRKGTDKLDSDAVWNKGDKKQEAGRHRAAILSEELKTKLGELKKGKKANVALDLTVDFLADNALQYEKSSRGAVQNFLVSMQGGQSGFALKDTSTLGRIDRAFGLVPAADISGTTADTLFFFSKFPGIDPLFQILPLATIVAGAHHSLIEVALPLSQNKVIDYEIGLYGTLLPGKAKHSAVGAVKKVLEMAQNEKLNHYLLVWYGKDGKAIEGCYEFFPSEKKSFEAFRKFAKGTNALTTFAKVKTIDKATIEDLVKSNGLDAK